MRAIASDDPAPVGDPALAVAESDDEDDSLVEEAPTGPAPRHVPPLLAPHPRFSRADDVEPPAHRRRPRYQHGESSTCTRYSSTTCSPRTTFDSFPVAALYLGITLVEGVVTWVDEFLTAWVGERFVLNLRVDLFTHMQRLSLDFFERRQLGDMMSRLGSDVATSRRWS